MWCSNYEPLARCSGSIVGARCEGKLLASALHVPTRRAHRLHPLLHVSAGDRRWPLLIRQDAGCITSVRRGNRPELAASPTSCVCLPKSRILQSWSWTQSNSTLDRANRDDQHQHQQPAPQSIQQHQCSFLSSRIVLEVVGTAAGIPLSHPPSIPNSSLPMTLHPHALARRIVSSPPPPVSNPSSTSIIPRPRRAGGVPAGTFKQASGRCPYLARPRFAHRQKKD